MVIPGVQVPLIDNVWQKVTSLTSKPVWSATPVMAGGDETKTVNAVGLDQLLHWPPLSS
jgi:hypothetical protein